ncbi:alanyl-tRNA editing protein [Pseudalkalibacillus sp. A8]|uniref:alanyl-tRNA editing protein n=1 Tax=Pseudalkalibacillus sp. A8 TaxID=3382641 RepID=UPI0038B44FC0
MAVELFLEDSYLKECQANIVEVEGNKVKLDQTVFYPTGGGQEHDTGHLLQNGREYEVKKVKKENGDIVHYVKDPEGLEEREVTAIIDWNRRYSLMKHHSLLHVLASVFNTVYGSLCTGNQIYSDRARIDLTEIHSLGKEDFDRIVEQANREIQANHLISSRVLPREEAKQISGAIKTVVNLIPSFVKEIRLVKIGDIDEQACGGTHVGQTKEIGGVVLDKVKNKGKGGTRLEVRTTTVSPI